MLGDLAYRVGTAIGTGLGTIEAQIGASSNAANPSNAAADDSADVADGNGAGSGDGDLLVDSVLGAVAGWTVKKLLRPRSVSWPRVVVAGIGATVLSDMVGRALGPPSEERDRAYEEDPDALLVRIAAGIALAAGYAAILYPRLPGSPLTRGAIFGAMDIAAAPHGGLVRVATDTPGLKFPLKDLAVPIDQRVGPLANLTFGLAVGVLYRPGSDDD